MVYTDAAEAGVGKTAAAAAAARTVGEFPACKFEQQVRRQKSADRWRSGHSSSSSTRSAPPFKFDTCICIVALSNYKSIPSKPQTHDRSYNCLVLAWVVSSSCRPMLVVPRRWRERV